MLCYMNIVFTKSINFINWHYVRETISQKHIFARHCVILLSKNLEQARRLDSQQAYLGFCVGKLTSGWQGLACPATLGVACLLENSSGP